MQVQSLVVGFRSRGLGGVGDELTERTLASGDSTSSGAHTIPTRNGRYRWFCGLCAHNVLQSAQTTFLDAPGVGRGDAVAAKWWPRATPSWSSSH